MVYQIKFKDSAKKEFSKLEKNLQIRIYNFLENRVKNNPHLLKESLLGNKKGLWKYRVGDYRLVCQILDDELIVLVVGVGHRREIYK
jgi:mRNA interferase RelE/StbE